MRFKQVFITRPGTPVSNLPISVQTVQINIIPNNYLYFQKTCAEGIRMYHVRMRTCGELQ